MAKNMPKLIYFEQNYFFSSMTKIIKNLVILTGEMAKNPNNGPNLAPTTG